MQIDHRVTQLLCSRVCHDLVGPVGAINSGLELIADDASTEGEAMELIGMSAGQATRRLAFYRVAFGLGSGGGEGFIEAKALAEGWLDGAKVALDWPDAADAPGAVTPGAVKVALNMVLIGSETLIRGGTLAVRAAPLEDGLGVAVTARGPGARLKDDVAEALAPGAAAGDLSARNVHGYFAQVLAGAEGAVIEVSEADAEGGDAEVRLAVLLPGDAR